MITMKQWKISEKSFTQFVKLNEQIDFEIYNYFLGVVYPVYMENNVFLCGEPYDMNNIGEMLYMTFKKIKNKYFYKGLFTLNEIKK